MTTPAETFVVRCGDYEKDGFKSEAQARRFCDEMNGPRSACSLPHMVLRRVWRDGAWVTTPIGGQTAEVTTPNG